jgi:hypothetical protein
MVIAVALHFVVYNVTSMPVCAEGSLCIGCSMCTCSLVILSCTSALSSRMNPCCSCYLGLTKAHISNGRLEFGACRWERSGCTVRAEYNSLGTDVLKR